MILLITPALSPRKFGSFNVGKWSGDHCKELTDMTTFFPQVTDNCSFMSSAISICGFTHTGHLAGYSVLVWSCSLIHLLVAGMRPLLCQFAIVYDRCLWSSMFLVLTNPLIPAAGTVAVLC